MNIHTRVEEVITDIFSNEEENGRLKGFVTAISNIYWNLMTDNLFKDTGGK